MPTRPRGETPSASNSDKGLPVPPGTPETRPATPTARVGDTQAATAARVNRQQAAASARVRAAADKQDAVAARVNRRQAAVAAEVAAGQKATAAAGRGVGDRGADVLRQAARPLGQVLTFPYVLGRTVAEDVVSTAKRPDVVLYWTGLAGLAVLGVLEWPAAAAVGAGVAIASGVRRSRA